ncbi:hypothetical protein F2Q69_00028815 [Brassica cretica]|uniref:Uncharacterized protein n=1 Tax=Brassica cretica TaxID=69181 RepID=A0A8S9RYC0_BRACR|nr:hypothetical protein F2Q69_00028815 [Brassica cretica]
MALVRSTVKTFELWSDRLAFGKLIDKLYSFGKVKFVLDEEARSVINVLWHFIIDLELCRDGGKPLGLNLDPHFLQRDEGRKDLSGRFRKVCPGDVVRGWRDTGSLRPYDVQSFEHGEGDVPAFVWCLYAYMYRKSLVELENAVTERA